MTLIKTQVKTYRVDKVCDKCKKGLLIANGNAMHFNFYSLYTHVCNECGEVVQLQNESYPHETTKDIGKPKRVKETQDLLAEHQNIANEINYNNLCAKATLGDLPTITAEELMVQFNPKPTKICPDCGGEGYTFFVNQGEPDPDSKCTTCNGTGKIHLKRNPNTL